MTEDAPARTRIRIDWASELVAAYVSGNAVPAAELPGLIASLGATMERLASGRAGDAETRTPAREREDVGPTEIRKSMTGDALVSFLDGKPYKTLKRHLSKHGLTPEDYRACFGLPADYPMVSRSYSERQVAIARSIGLGRKASGKGGKAPR